MSGDSDINPAAVAKAPTDLYGDDRSDRWMSIVSFMGLCIARRDDIALSSIPKTPHPYPSLFCL